jgi:rod shape-determining protein MreD
VRRVLLPVILVVFFLFESVFVSLVPVDLVNPDFIFVPRLLLIGIMFLAIYGGRTQAIIYGFIFGLLFDIFYTEIIGVYLYLFPLLAYVTAKLMKVLQANVFISSIVTLLGVCLLEIAVYEMNFLIHITDMTFTTFIEHRLYPTSALNFILTLIVAYPLKRFIIKWAVELRNE